MSSTPSRLPRGEAREAPGSDKQTASRAGELAAARVLLLRRAADIPRSAVWHWDLKTGAVEWGKGLKTIFGYAETVTDAAWRENRIYPEDRERVVLSLQRATVINDGSVWSGRYRFQMANGTWAQVVERASVLRDDLGPRSVLGAITTTTIARHRPRGRRGSSRGRAGA